MRIASMARRPAIVPLISLMALASGSASGQEVSSAAAPPPAARVGIVLPEVQLDRGAVGEEPGEPVRQLIISHMEGPVLELVPLQARIPSKIEAEASSRNCTHLLYTSIGQGSDEITLTYEFVTIDGARAPLSDTLRSRAGSDGENSLGPLVEQVATIAITAALE